MAREVFDGVLSVIGHGSDGDSRRFRLQQLGMNSEAGIRFGCLAPCFHLTCMQVSGGYRHLHSQDPLHNAKKLQSPADVTSRNLYVGNELATWAMLDQVWRCHNPQDHGLRREDVTRSDRQSVRTVTVTTAKKARECLRKMREEPKDGQSPKDTLGLEIWFQIISKYMLVFYSKKHSAGERVRLASCVLNFLHIKRHWVAKHNNLSLAKNAESKQCFDHVELSLCSAILKLRVFATSFSHLPWNLSKTGSDCCEILFSQLGGCGKIQINRRTYTVGDALGMLGDITTLFVYEHDPENPVSLPRHPSRSCPFAGHEDPNAPDCDFNKHLTDAEEASQAALGLFDAQEMCCKVGMNDEKEAYWNQPWIGSGALRSKMREQDQFDALQDDQVGGEHEQEGDEHEQVRTGKIGGNPKEGLVSATLSNDDDEEDDDDEYINRPVSQAEIDENDELIVKEAEISIPDTESNIESLCAMRQMADEDEEDEEDHQRSKISQKLHVAGRGEVWKQTLVGEANLSIKSGTRLSSDRLRFINQVHSQQINVHELNPSEPCIMIGTDIAVLCEDGWFLGRVLKMHNVTNSSRTQWRLPVIFATMPATFRVICKFYRATKNPKLFRYNSPDADEYAAVNIISRMSTERSIVIMST